MQTLEGKKPAAEKQKNNLPSQTDLEKHLSS